MPDDSARLCSVKTEAKTLRSHFPQMLSHFSLHLIFAVSFQPDSLGAAYQPGQPCWAKSAGPWSSPGAQVHPVLYLRTFGSRCMSCSLVTRCMEHKQLFQDPWSLEPREGGIFGFFCPEYQFTPFQHTWLKSLTLRTLGPFSYPLAPQSSSFSAYFIQGP